MAGTEKDSRRKLRVPLRPVQVAAEVDLAPHGGQRALSEEDWAWIAEIFGLTPRELDVTRCQFDTGHLRYMAQMLGISLNTVRTHLKRAHKKIGVEDRGDLILTILERVRARTDAAAGRTDVSDNQNRA